MAVIAGLACLACCLIPVLLTAGVLGVLGGAAWITLGRWMPTITLALAAAAAGLFWVAVRRRRPTDRANCGSGCRCDRSAATAA